MLPADTRDEGLPERSLGRHHRGRFGTPYGGKTKESRMDEDSRTKHDKAEAEYTGRTVTKGAYDPSQCSKSLLNA